MHLFKNNVVLNKYGCEKTPSPLALYQNPLTSFTKNLHFVVVTGDFVFLSPLCFRVRHSLPGAYSRETTHFSPVLMLRLSLCYVIRSTALSETRLLERPEAGLNGL